MPDSRLNEAERSCSIRSGNHLFSMACYGCGVLPAHLRDPRCPIRRPLPAAVASRLSRFDLAGQACPLRLAGAWSHDGRRSRFGGVSALAIDQGASSRSAISALIRFDPPDLSAQARVSDLRDGPGPGCKNGRAMPNRCARSEGRGWWVGYEQRSFAGSTIRRIPDRAVSPIRFGRDRLVANNRGPRRWLPMVAGC